MYIWLYGRHSSLSCPMISASRRRTTHLIVPSWICSSCCHRLLKRPSNSFSSISNGSKSKVRENERPQRRSLSISWRKSFSTSSASLKAAPSQRNYKLPDFPARTRFAPSPTGYTHIGGLRTALFSYLLAKRTGGQFLLRIEDTDQKRLVPDAEQRLYSDLQRAGLQWDEGPIVGGPHGPYRQSERTAIYQEHASRLLDEGSAYRCFCSPQTSGPEQTAYVTSSCYQNCSSIPDNESQLRAESEPAEFTVRLRHPENASKRVYPDLVYGRILRLKRSPTTPQSSSEAGSINTDIADTVLLKSDGTPTYHFANVIDDHLMQITHVIRGSEWAASTPLHYDIYTALGWKPPQFAHVGLLVDEKEAKLSKRNSDIALDVASMRDEQGVLPQTLNNFLVLLGWSNPLKSDVMDMEELIQNFDLKFTRGNTMVKTEKLDYLQRQHVARLCAQATATESNEGIKDIVSRIAQQVRKTYHPVIINQDLTEGNTLELQAALEVYCTHILLADSKNYVNAPSFVERNRYFFQSDSVEIPGTEPQQPNQEQLKCGQVQMKGLLDVRVDLARTLGEDFEWRLSEESGVGGGGGGGGIADLERRLHAVLVRQIWLMALQLPLRYLAIHDAPVDLDIAAEHQYRAAWERLRTKPVEEAIPQGADMSSEAIARALLAGEEEGRCHEEKVTALVWRHKVCNAALMKYLRLYLTYGMTGPGLSLVMALLGKEEVGRRLRSGLRGL